MNKGFGVGILVVSVMLGAAAAQDEKKRDPEVIFKKLDTNTDDHLSKTEFLKLAEFGKDKGKAREILGKAFEKIVDARAKGMTRDQFKKFMIDTQKKKPADPRDKAPG